MLNKRGSTSKGTVLIGLMFFLVFCLLSIPAFGEATDYEKMDYNSLLALKQEVDLELNSRPEAAPLILNPGQYTQ